MRVRYRLTGSCTIVDADVESIRAVLFGEQFANDRNLIPERGEFLRRQFKNGSYVSLRNHERMAFGDWVAVEERQRRLGFEKDAILWQVAEWANRPVHAAQCMHMTRSKPAGMFRSCKECRAIPYTASSGLQLQKRSKSGTCGFLESRADVRGGTWGGTADTLIDGFAISQAQGSKIWKRAIQLAGSDISVVVPELLASLRSQYSFQPKGLPDFLKITGILV